MGNKYRIEYGHWTTRAVDTRKRVWTATHVGRPVMPEAEALALAISANDAKSRDRSGVYRALPARPIFRKGDFSFPSRGNYVKARGDLNPATKCWRIEEAHIQPGLTLRTTGYAMVKVRLRGPGGKTKSLKRMNLRQFWSRYRRTTADQEITLARVSREGSQKSWIALKHGFAFNCWPYQEKWRENLGPVEVPKVIRRDKNPSLAELVGSMTPPKYRHIISSEIPEPTWRKLYSCPTYAGLRYDPTLDRLAADLRRGAEQSKRDEAAYQVEVAKHEADALTAKADAGSLKPKFGEEYDSRIHGQRVRVTSSAVKRGADEEIVVIGRFVKTGEGFKYNGRLNTFLERWKLVSRDTPAIAPKVEPKGRAVFTGLDLGEKPSESVVWAATVSSEPAKVEPKVGQVWLRAGEGSSHHGEKATIVSVGPRYVCLRYDGGVKVMCILGCLNEYWQFVREPAPSVYMWLGGAEEV